MRPHDRTRAAGKIVRFRRRRGLLRAVMNTLLAFDTATERISIALAARGQVWQHDGEGGAKASATFLPAILGLLRDAGVQVTDLDAIAFGRGPGAFTGLRTACSVAQGLAFGSGRPVLPIDTLLALAEDARVGADPVRIWAVMDARMQEIYAARYAYDGEGWSVVDAPMLTTAARLNERWRIERPEVVAGNALAAFAELDAAGARCVPTATPRALGMLPLARALAGQGGAVDAAAALPRDLRDKVAETTVERAARAAAPG
jgi:tRNA threonylcarbamoyladenosine biosynthesis protein TsaB